MSHQNAAAEGWKILRSFIVQRQKELDVTDYRLAKLTGLQQSTISRYMSGQSEPGIVNFLAILGALNLRPYIVPSELDKDQEFNRIFFN